MGQHQSQAALSAEEAIEARELYRSIMADGVVTGPEHAAMTAQLQIVVSMTEKTDIYQRAGNSVTRTGYVVDGILRAVGDVLPEETRHVALQDETASGELAAVNAR